MEVLFGLFIWFIVSILIAGFASNRGRSGAGWFLVSFFLSPFIAILFLLLLPNLERDRIEAADRERAIEASQAFEPDGFFSGIPYRVGQDGVIEAVVQGSRLKFSDMQKFTAMMDGRH